MDAAVGLLLCLGLLAMWLRIRYEEYVAKQAACLHSWDEPVSLYGEGKVWKQQCRLCRQQRDSDGPRG